MFILQLNNHEPSTWLEVDEAGEVISSSLIADLSQAPKLNPDAHLTILFPGEDIFMTSVKLPKMSASEKLQAIPFTIEEQLASDPEKIGIAMGDNQADGSSIVAVFDKAHFESQWRVWHAQHFTPWCVIPDFLVLQLIPDAWSILVKNKMALVRTDIQDGFSIDVDNLFVFLQLMLNRPKKNKPTRFICWQENAVIDVVQLEKLGLPVELRDPSRENPFDMKTLITKPAFNLLQGKFQTKRQSSLLRKNWILSGIAACALIGLLFFGNVAEWFYFHHQSTILQAQITQIYRQLFPGATDVLEPHFRVAGLLKKFQGVSQDDAFLVLSGTTGEAILHFPELQTQSLDYTKNKLSVTLQAKKMATLTQCLQVIRSKGFEVSQKISKTGKDQVEAIITVSRSA